MHYSTLGSCSSCHRGNAATDRKKLAHAGFVRGRHALHSVADAAVAARWEDDVTGYGCRRCHVIAGRGNGLAVDLDDSARNKSPDELAASIMVPVMAMPDFRFDDKRVDAIVNRLLSAARSQGAKQQSKGVKVHFNSGDLSAQDVFTKKCGSCHKALTEAFGVRGRGGVAPDLSGLLSDHYPKSYQGRDGWSAKKLEKWLLNPRSIRENAKMQPVILSRGELRELEGLLTPKQ